MVNKKPIIVPNLKPLPSPPPAKPVLRAYMKPIVDLNPGELNHVQGAFIAYATNPSKTFWVPFSAISWTSGDW